MMWFRQMAQLSTTISTNESEDVGRICTPCPQCDRVPLNSVSQLEQRAATFLTSNRGFSLPVPDGFAAVAAGGSTSMGVDMMPVSRICCEEPARWCGL